MDVAEADDSGIGITPSAWRIIDLRNGAILGEGDVEGLLVGAANGTVVTLSNVDHDPTLIATDIDSGRQRWKRHFYRNKDIDGFMSKSVFMDADRVVISSSPTTWLTSALDGDHRQTRVVELATGKVTLLSGTTALGLDPEGIVVREYVKDGYNSSKHIAYYPL